MCHIENFAIKKQSNGKFLVEWNAINVDKVTINGRDVTGQNRLIATVKDSQTILLRVDNTGSYATSDNQAATHKTIKPNYDSSSYTDVEIFMPYNELEVGTGKHNLKFYCKIWEYSTSSAISVAESQYYSFTLTNN